MYSEDYVDAGTLLPTASINTRAPINAQSEVVCVSGPLHPCDRNLSIKLWHSRVSWAQTVMRESFSRNHPSIARTSARMRLHALPS